MFEEICVMELLRKPTYFSSIFMAAMLFVFPLCARAQIKLLGYKCKYYDGQQPYTMSEMFSKNDTFRFALISRDIGDKDDAGKKLNPSDELKVGLQACFGKYPYFKTKDDLYISTGKYTTTSAYYYKVYVPEQQISLSLRSAKNDTIFSDKSKWLLQQIRDTRKKKGEFYFMNEKGETCQVPDDLN